MPDCMQRVRVLVLVPCVSVCVCVRIDFPIKNAATNVLNGFKMSFRYVFLRPYLVWSGCSSLFFIASPIPSSSCYAWSINYLSLSLSHTTLQLVLTWWRRWPSVRTHIAYYFIRPVRGWTFARRSKSKLRFFFFFLRSFCSFHFKGIHGICARCAYVTTYVRDFENFEFRRKGKWKVLTLIWM